jgi:hypothetical protein
MMVFDLHIHTRIGSGDSSIEYEELIPWAKKAGLGGICITEHGKGKTGIAEKLARQYDFIVLEGFETSTQLGDMLVFGVESLPRAVYKAEEVRDLVKEAGGMIFAAHPFRAEITRPIMQRIKPRLTLKEATSRRLLQLVDGIEVANGWSCEEDVDFCLRLCSLTGQRGIAASDAHMPRQIGCCVTIFDNKIRNERELIAELQGGRFRVEDRRPKKERNPNLWLW